jgi:hypothetical protein
MKYILDLKKYLNSNYSISNVSKFFSQVDLFKVFWLGICPRFNNSVLDYLKRTSYYSGFESR